MIKPEIMAKIITGYSLPVMGIHGFPHWGRVLETGLRLSAETGADRAVIKLFSVFHDARRQNEEIDPGHGRRGAELASHLRTLLQVTDAQFGQLVHACTHHTDGTILGDPTAQTCWDADRLDLWRVGITPRNSRLCTDAARSPDIRKWSRIRSVDDYLSDYAVEWRNCNDR